mgnify:CR=1 FL=1|tara:strand:+ start:3685 stop:3849 length:165 start_codon:yes stop_codon:yes gene_type:complete
MDKHLTHEEMASNLAQKMAEKASEKELRMSYEDRIFQELAKMNKEEFNEVLWHG